MLHDDLRISGPSLSRRQLLARCGMGMGALTLAMMLESLGAPQAQGAMTYSPLAAKKAPLPAKAKHVIHIFAEGGPSHVDTWDPKPALAKYADQSLPGLNGVAYASPFKFEKKGKSGIEVSELFPMLGSVIDQSPLTILPHVPDPRAFLDEDMVFRRYACPGCHTLLTTEIARASEPVLGEVRFL